MKMVGLISMVGFLLIAPVADATETAPFSMTKKGFFSLGANYGMGRYRFLNTDGGQAGYRINHYGVDSDLRLWNFGAGDFRIFATYQNGDGKSTSRASDTIHTNEATAGIKFFAGPNLFLSASYGQGQTKISSAEYVQNVSLTYQLYRAGLGVEFPLSSSISFGIEFSYRNGPIKRADNSQLLENTFVEGMAAALRLVWSPPTLDLNLAD